MKARGVVALICVVAACVGGSGPVLAQQETLQVQAGDTVRSVLERQMGRRVTLRLDAGAEISGTVAKVGQSLVHLSELTGREFFDAVVPIERIQAVIVRTRTR